MARRITSRTYRITSQVRDINGGDMSKSARNKKLKREALKLSRERLASMLDLKFTDRVRVAWQIIKGRQR